MIIVLDTNIWKANLYLKSSASAAVKFYLQHHNAKVGLPEVIRLEVEKHLRSDIYEFRDQITKGYNQLLGLFNKLYEIVLPTDSDIEGFVASIFSKSGFDLQEIHFGLESARDSFLRTVDKIPPSHKTQQFKDGVIWKDCMTLANAEDVVLVTGDRAFYEGEDIKNGLSKALAKEATQCRYNLKVLPSLTDLLNEFKKPVVVNDIVFEKAVSDFLQKHVDEILMRSEFYIVSHWRFKKSFFATENFESLYIDFVAEADCEDITGKGRMNSVLQISADGLYSLKNEALCNIQPRRIVITYTTSDGTSEDISSGFTSINIALGHKVVTNVVREPLDLME